jgi:hypothetical protein
MAVSFADGFYGFYLIHADLPRDIRPGQEGVIDCGTSVAHPDGGDDYRLGGTENSAADRAAGDAS